MAVDQATGEISRIAVKIMGQEYVVRTNEPETYVRQLARDVDRKMVQIAKTNNNLPPVKVAVLAALNLADELSRLREDYASLIKLIDEEKNG